MSLFLLVSCVLLLSFSPFHGSSPFFAFADIPSDESISNTLLVTYKSGCVQEATRHTLLSRSVQDAVFGAGRHPSRSDADVVVERSPVVEEQITASSTFRVFSRSAAAKFPEGEGGGGCQVEETWLKIVGLQIIRLVGNCERVGKDELLGRLGQEECVLSAETDAKRYPTGVEEGGIQRLREVKSRRLYTPTDPLYHYQWHLDDTNEYSVGARAAWDITRGGSGDVSEQPDNTVGIVDFGFLESHADLNPRWWSNVLEDCDTNGINGVDEDSNGYVDDCHGWNFGTNSNNLDGYTHGTKVAGAVTAQANNDEGITGICMNCRILPTTVGFSVGSELAGVNYILSKGVRVINLSVGGARSEAEYQAFLQNSNCLFVVSAGNEYCNLDGMPETNCFTQGGSSAGYPAGLSDELTNVVSVGALQPDGNRSIFSNYGAKRVQVFAPGSDVVTTDVYGGGTGYSNRSGTSYSSPIVAGIAGLVHQQYPHLTPCELRQILILSCSINSKIYGTVECNGQVNAAAALAVAAGKACIYACPTSGSTSASISSTA